MNLIITKNGNDKGTLYRFNKDFDTWKPLPKKVIITKNGNNRYQKRKSALPKIGHTKETITKALKPIREEIKKQAMEYQYDDEPRKIRKYKKATKEQNNFLISIGFLWVQMASKHFGWKEDQVPIKNIYYPIRACWEREKWSKDEFKDLFQYFLTSSLKEDDKISFDLCLSEKFVAKYKIAKKNKAKTNADISREIKL